MTPEEIEDRLRNTYEWLKGRPFRGPQPRDIDQGVFREDDE